MAIQGDGLYSWPEDHMYDGIRQDASESVQRFRTIENMNWHIQGALTKDLGTRFLTENVIESGTYNTVLGFDAHFFTPAANTPIQRLIIVNEVSGGQRVFIYDTDDDEFDKVTSPALHETNRPCAFMLNNELILVDGLRVNAMTSAKVWSTPSSGVVDDPIRPDRTEVTGDNPDDFCRFGGVYANRAVYAGHRTYPSSFWPTAVLDPTRLDLTHEVQVSGSYGQEITFMGPCGRYWMVGTRNMTRAYYLGLSGPKDWDFDDVSNMIGGINWESYCAPGRAGGGEHGNFSFVWSDEGPVMFADGGGKGGPVAIPLWESLQQAVRGNAWQGNIGLNTARYSSVVTEFCPEYGEVRFAVTENKPVGVDDDLTNNNVIYCLDYKSAIRYAMGRGYERETGQDPTLYPFWRIRKNQVRGWVPCDYLFQVRVASTGQPSTSGQSRMFGCREGYVYEYDAPNVFKDANPPDAEQAFSMKLRRDGYDGYRDGIREYTKSNRHIFMRSTQTGGDVKATLYADGGVRAETRPIENRGGLPYWDDGGTWEDGRLWSAGELATQRTEVASKGKKFDLEFDDEGTIAGDFSLNSWSLSGFVDKEM